jgi:FkbM family methyltransferase
MTYFETIRRNFNRMYRSFNAIWKHPLTQKDKFGALRRYISFHVLGRLSRKSILFPYVGKTSFLASPGMAGIVGNIYMGLEDFEEQAFLLHYLRSGDLFVDVGANVGAYSLLASGVCEAKSFAIEPIPSTFSKLMQNIRLNDLTHLVTGYNVGIGSECTRMCFTSSLDVLNKVVLENDPNKKSANIIQVDVLSLDSLLEGKSPALLKIDVEGYEQEVIRGSSNTLKSNNLQAIIIELWGHDGRYGFSSESIHNDLLKIGFLPFRYYPFERRLEKIHAYNQDKFNTLYVRDLGLVEARIKQADHIKVLGQAI